jgi:hypothetical protein
MGERHKHGTNQQEQRHGLERERQPVRPRYQEARREDEGGERAVDEQKAHVEGADAAQHEIGDGVAGMDRRVGNRSKDRDGAGGEEGQTLTDRANVGAIGKMRGVEPDRVFHCPVPFGNAGGTSSLGGS